MRKLIHASKAFLLFLFFSSPTFKVLKFASLNKSIRLILILTVTLIANITTAQHGHGGHGGNNGTSMPKGYEKKIPLYKEALGKYSHPISNTDTMVQAYFKQGLQLKYAFGVNEAARSFRQARMIDTTCAVCYWGEAWALGSYLNGKMNKAKAPLAYHAVQMAMMLSKKHASPLEQDLIEALSVRYIEDFDPETRGVQDTMYAEAMAKVYEKYPNDLEVATVYAEALFVLEPRRGTRDIKDPDVQKLHKILEKALEQNIEHPGACHLYIHATESTSRPDLGESCAAFISNAIPGASHINHMPSHTYNEVGRWSESVRANLEAWHSDQKSKYDLSVAIYPSHNLHMLYYSAAYDGQGAIAIQAASDFARMTGNTMHHVMALIRFGRFEEVLEIEKRPSGDISGGMWDFAQGYAHLRNDESDFAQLYLKRVQIIADTSEAIYRGHPAAHILGVLAGILQSEIERDSGNLGGAIRSIKAAVAIEDEMQYDEPEPMPFDSRHWLGATLMEAERYEEAEEVYKTELVDHPKNGWSYFGLIKALEAQEKDASEIQEKFDKSWERADHWIRASRF